MSVVTNKSPVELQVSQHLEGKCSASFLWPTSCWLISYASLIWFSVPDRSALLTPFVLVKCMMKSLKWKMELGNTSSALFWTNIELLLRWWTGCGYLTASANFHHVSSTSWFGWIGIIWYFGFGWWATFLGGVYRQKLMHGWVHTQTCTLLL